MKYKERQEGSRMGKYFIAIVPPEPVLVKVREIKESICLQYNSCGALRSPGHITLHSPFEWKEEGKLIEILSEFKFDEKDFQILLKGFNCFEPRVIYVDVLRNEKLFYLQRELVYFVKSKLRLFNQSDDKRGFHPHVTVAFRGLKKAVFNEIYNEYKEKEFNMDFNCKTFSLLKQLGQKWEVIENFDLIN